MAADTHWKDVKLAELPSWLSRRSPNPIDMGRATARGKFIFQNSVLPTDLISYLLDDLVSQNVQL